MPRYFFHLHDGQDLPAHEGRELADLRAAQRDAAEIVYLQLREDAEAGLMTQEWTLDVQDGGRQTLFTLRFKATRPG